MTVDEVIIKIEEYETILEEARNCGCYGTRPYDILRFCDKLKALDIEWGGKLFIPDDFTVTKQYYITNSKTHYHPKEEWYIHWDNGNEGRLQFVPFEYWAAVGKEWEAFMNEMLSFNSLDYDPLNNHIIYDIENGKKAMANYSDLCKRTKEAMNDKIKEVKIKEMEKELAKLKEQE